MSTINCFLSGQLTREASFLRDQSFSTDPNRSIADRFDAKAKHILIEIDSQLAGYARLSGGPNGYFEALIDPPVPFPTGPHIADGSRVTVSPHWRGVDLSSLLLIELLLWAYTFEYRYLVGSVKTGRRTLELVHGLGFVNCGEPVIQHFDRINVPSPFKEQVFFQCVVAELMPISSQLVERHAELVSQLAQRGFTVKTDCPFLQQNQV